MIGRAAVGNPWIFARLDRGQVSAEMLRQMVHQHMHRSLTFYGERKGLVLFRRHAQSYLKFQHLPRAVRAEMISQNDAGSFLSMLDAYCARLTAR
jgi:tRNA-dihydrouridine synthase B